jgi:eukaryotic-like serine/threonine-protein kinase
MDALGCPMHGLPQDESTTFVTAVEAEQGLPAFEGYRTEGVLGRGGFGTVYLASALGETPRRVAIKVAHSTTLDAKRRLQREVNALQLIGPPYVPAVIKFDDSSVTSPYVVMELVAGVPLAELLGAQKPPLSVDNVCKIATVLLESLAAVHDKRLVHGDMKPENVLLAEDFGHATILDLGLARRISASRDGSSTPPTTLAGTMEYMSPEQCESRHNTDARADLYAVGVMLYEMLTGHVPFWGAPAAVREGHLSRRPARMSVGHEGYPQTVRSPSSDAFMRGPTTLIPEVLEDIVSRCLEKDPVARFETAETLRAAIEEASRVIKAQIPTPTTASSDQDSVLARRKTAGAIADIRDGSKKQCW